MIKLIGLCLTLLLMTGNNTMQFDFGEKKDGANWSALNDGVMGGLSTGQVDLTDNALRFTGKVSLENNGGFASVRNRFASYDLSEFDKVSLRYKSEGQTFSITLEHNTVWYQPYFKLLLPETEGEWKSVTMDLKDFKAYRVGQEIDLKLTPEICAQVKRIGFVTSTKSPTQYSLEVDYLRFE